MPPKTKKPAAKETTAPAKSAIAKKAVPAKGPSKVVPAAKKPEPVVEKTSVWESKPRNFSVGGNIQPKRDLTRFTRWPKYVIMQRKKRVLQQRLTVPPVLNQFTKTLDANTAANLFKLLKEYKPEDKAAKKARLLKVADGSAQADKTKPIVVKHGINHVTKLIEDKKATLVVIAHDVDPIELVLYLPALCKKQDIPYCFVKGKARLGQLIGKKTATAVALTSVKEKDRQAFAQIVTVVRSQYNSKYDEMRRQWGKGTLGLKSKVALLKREKAQEKEARDKQKYQ
jgi:large subunit ribosomal protein L7Ae